MAWNGAGTFSRTNGDKTGTTVWQQDQAAAIDIEADRHDTHDQDLAAGINACLAKNGENSMTGDLNMGSNDITNGGAASFSSVTIGGKLALTDLLEDRGSYSGNGAIEIDLSAAVTNRVTLTGAAILSFVNPTSGRVYQVELLQDASGSHTVTWPGTVKWPGGTAPTLTETASRKDVFTLVWNGTNYLAATFGLDYSDTV